MSKLQAIDSIYELQRLCKPGREQSEQYKKLAECAAQNLGMPENWGTKSNNVTDQHIEWLNMNAMETTEEGVVDEINFCLDIVK